MSWSTWGLTDLDDRASDRTVLAGGGRVLTLGISKRRATPAERFGDRWSISVVELAATALVPRRGDIVIWRAVEGEDSTDRSVWGGPTRVLSVNEGARPEVVEVCTLHDAVLDERRSEEDIEWLEDAVSEDRVVSEQEAWEILGCWRLHPLCPRCGGNTRAYVYGMPSPDTVEGSDFAIGGCVLDPDLPTHACVVCAHDF